MRGFAKCLSTTGKRTSTTTVATRLTTKWRRQFNHVVCRDGLLLLDGVWISQSVVLREEIDWCSNCIGTSTWLGRAKRHRCWIQTILRWGRDWRRARISRGRLRNWIKAGADDSWNTVLHRMRIQERVHANQEVCRSAISRDHSHGIRIPTASGEGDAGKSSHVRASQLCYRRRIRGQSLCRHGTTSSSDACRHAAEQMAVQSWRLLPWKSDPICPASNWCFWDLY